MLRLFVGVFLVLVQTAAEIIVEDSAEASGDRAQQYHQGRIVRQAHVTEKCATKNPKETQGDNDAQHSLHMGLRYDSLNVLSVHVTDPACQGTLEGQATQCPPGSAADSGHHGEPVGIP